MESIASIPVNEDYTPRQVAALLNQASIQLIDVREDYEFDAGRISGAVHIPLAELPGQAERIERDRPVVFYCRSGSRSAMAARAFDGAGYEAHNMAGGLLDWEADGLPMDPDDGYVAGH
jgi:rhodanese-related sulfurtransferase